LPEPTGHEQSDGTEGEGQREEFGPNETREEREPALIGEAREHVDEEDERKRATPEGPWRSARAHARGGDLGGETRDEEQEERQETWEGQEAGHGPPGPTGRQRRADERRTRGN